MCTMIRVIHGRKLDVDNSNKNNNMKEGDVYEVGGI